MYIHVQDTSHTGTQKNRHPATDIDTQTHRHADTQTHRHTDTDTQTHRHTADTQTHRHTADTQTHSNKTHIHTDPDTQTHRHPHKRHDTNRTLTLCGESAVASETNKRKLQEWQECQVNMFHKKYACTYIEGSEKSRNLGRVLVFKIVSATYVVVVSSSE